MIVVPGLALFGTEVDDASSNDDSHREDNVAEYVHIGSFNVEVGRGRLKGRQRVLDVMSMTMLVTTRMNRSVFFQV